MTTFNKDDDDDDNDDAKYYKLSNKNVTKTTATLGKLLKL